MTSPTLDDSLAVARSLVSDGAFEQAHAHLQETVGRFPASAEAWKLLGVAANKLGRQAEAAQHLRRSLEADPDDSDAWSSLGGVHVAAGDYAEAMDAFAHALDCDGPTTYELLNYLTMAALVGDVDAALTHWSTTLADGRRQCEAQIAAGDNVPWCYFDLAQIALFEEAAGSLEPALREALRRSSAWQVASARRTYELLAGTERFGSASRAALALLDGAGTH